MKWKSIFLSLTIASCLSLGWGQQVHASAAVDAKTATADTEQQNSNAASDQSQSADQNQKQNQTEPTEPTKPTKPDQPSTPAGWQKEQQKRVYWKNNHKVTGRQKIAGSWYLFDKHGYLQTGLQRLPKAKSYAYFDAKGKQRFKNTKTKRAYYWISKKGQITGIKNYAKVICQRPQLPTGCEITAVTMMLNFAGKKVSKFRAAALMHRSSNPNKGFIGSPYKKYPGGYWVAPKGVQSVVKHYLHRAKIMTRASIKAIKAKLLQSHLVVAWVGWWDGFSNHALALTGYHGNRIYYNDPWTGTKRSMSLSTFKRHWRYDKYRALSY